MMSDDKGEAPGLARCFFELSLQTVLYFDACVKKQ